MKAHCRQLCFQAIATITYYQECQNISKKLFSRFEAVIHLNFFQFSTQPPPPPHTGEGQLLADYANATEP